MQVLFLEEAHIMKQLEHKNIVRLLGVCTKDEPICVVMELMVYGDLKSYLLSHRVSIDICLWTCGCVILCNKGSKNCGLVGVHAFL